MTIYTVHLPPSGGTAAEMERARFIPERPSLLALVVPAIWLLWHRLWYALAVYLLVGGIASVLVRWTDSAAIGLLAALPGIYLFLEGRQLLRGKLERAGWRFAGVVDAEDADEADLRFFAGDSLEKSPAPAPDRVPDRGPRQTLAAAMPASAPKPLDDKASPIGIFGQ